MERADLERLDELERNATKGPWRWNLSKRSKQITLVADCAGYEYVIDFARWGMSGATPRFRKQVTPKLATLHNAVEFAAVVPGREHHADWFQTVDHPDANLITELRNAYRSMSSELSRLRAREAVYLEEIEASRAVVSLRVETFGVKPALFIDAPSGPECRDRMARLHKARHATDAAREVTPHA